MLTLVKEPTVFARIIIIIMEMCKNLEELCVSHAEVLEADVEFRSLEICGLTGSL